MNNLVLSGVQFNIVWEDKHANIKKLESLLQDIPSDTDIVLFPEMFTTGFSMNARILAETMNGYTIEWMKKISKSLNKVIGGSIIIQDRQKYRNRFLWIEPEEKLRYYDKKHSFSPGGESEFYTSGDQRLIIEYKEWKIFPSICYDLRFPYWLKNDLYYDILLNVASWPMKRSEHWKTFLKSRAIENQAYTVGINRIGIDGRNIVYSGDSSIYDYNGDLLIALGNIEGIITSSLSKTKMSTYRKKFPFLNDQD